MADVAHNPAAVLSICATTSEKLVDLTIKNGQLIFMQDVGRIAFDYKGKRTFYNQINELETEKERVELTSPVNGKYYFVIEKAVLWRYFNGWIQLTSEPEDIVFIGVELPELGQPKKLYVSTAEGNESISIWDEVTDEYKVVADKTHDLTVDDIKAMFNN